HFPQARKRKSTVGEDPRQRRAHHDRLVLAVRTRNVRILERSDFEADAGEVDRRLELAGQVEWGDRRDTFVESLQFLEGLVGPPRRFPHAALHVVSEYRLGAKQRRQGRQILHHLGTKGVRDRACQLSQRQKRLDAVL